MKRPSVSHFSDAVARGTGKVISLIEQSLLISKFLNENCNYTSRGGKQFKKEYKAFLKPVLAYSIELALESKDLKK